MTMRSTTISIVCLLELGRVANRLVELTNDPIDAHPHEAVFAQLVERLAD